MSNAENQCISGVVVKLDRGFPLVRLATQELVRCEHATALVKSHTNRAVIGDQVKVRLDETHDKGIIQAIKSRMTEFVRRDPADRTVKQVLAANFTHVIIAEPITNLNYRRLERELVLAHETGAQVLVVLTKNDLIDRTQSDVIIQRVRDLAGDSVEVMAVSVKDKESLELLRQKMMPDHLAILIGKSGVGKSTLVNLLVQQHVQETASVRQGDGKGRHTTVDRVLVELAEGGAVVDMPGVRGLGIWDADRGLAAAFADIHALAETCRFRDCTHINEPGCAVLAAVEECNLTQARLDSYHALMNELAQVKEEREASLRLRGVKHSSKR